MDAMQAIRTRRSIRVFSPRPVPRSALEQILDAGAFAPSAKNARNWRFLVLEGHAREAVIGAMEQAAGQLPGGGSFHSVAGTVRAMRQAPVLITVHNTGALAEAFRAMGGFKERADPETERVLRDLEIQGVAAAIQNMLLSAHALGLGGLWIGDFHYARDKIQDLLRGVCPREMIAAVSLGYPARPAAAADRDWHKVTTWVRDL